MMYVLLAQTLAQLVPPSAVCAQWCNVNKKKKKKKTLNATLIFMCI